MPALDGAVALVQVDNVAVVVTEELDLDVLGLVEEALDEDGAVAEGALGLGGGTLEGLLELGSGAHNTHTAATATVSSLDDDGEAILVGELLDLLVALDGTLSTGDDRDAGSNGDPPGGDLVAEGVNDVGGRPDELVREKRVSSANAVVPQTGVSVLTIRPAFSTLRANSAFSERKP